ncbi:AraC family transcriptional regulator [Chitinophaga sancti]|uniref:AraC-type DNA-binding protein n=1 Tax=Chitinophaga sancti TaxID=1004 RepID=A0A1K1RB51_9BACT|nr:helix-turn-helix domain-containing protein [Chitinophaga sancti]WQD65537.1 helix-turn-helix transcriptional regulator [Chitinophaga sancti]WQG88840.1 helix-turn-helix transcriptional regulator [Chitinophaga sancti]SFW69027.1 AraC-type DNA-binding protein [Chitinophaga sancti]
MAKKRAPIPVNPMANQFGSGIAMEKLLVEKLNPKEKEEAGRAHREDGHSFFLLEKGKVTIEIDFEKIHIKPASLIYLHPNQVHRITTFENVAVCVWSINNEYLHPEYLEILEELTPARPILLKKETVSLLSDAVALGMRFMERQEDKLFHASIKDSCNALVALSISQFLDQNQSSLKGGRFETVTKSFRTLLERNYIQDKRPAAYAKKLNISIPYLNECVRHTTGFSVSHHIQQRVILEAKRLLVHSDQAIKEIATTLGYDDYPYFSRLFTKVTGKTPMAFRNKNLD